MDRRTILKLPWFPKVLVSLSKFLEGAGNVGVYERISADEVFLPLLPTEKVPEGRTNFARHLCRNQTSAEEIIWQELRVRR